MFFHSCADQVGTRCSFSSFHTSVHHKFSFATAPKGFCFAQEYQGHFSARYHCTASPPLLHDSDQGRLQVFRFSFGCGSPTRQRLFHSPRWFESGFSSVMVFDCRSSWSTQADQHLLFLCRRSRSEGHHEYHYTK